QKAILNWQFGNWKSAIPKICWARKSGPTTASQSHETPALILTQCRAPETPGHRPDEECAPAAVKARRSYPPDKPLPTRRGSQTGSCCFPLAKLRVTDSAFPNASADRGLQTARPSARRAGCSQVCAQSPRVASYHRRDLLDNDPRSRRVPPVAKSRQKPCVVPTSLRLAVSNHIRRSHALSASRTTCRPETPCRGRGRRPSQACRQLKPRPPLAATNRRQLSGSSTCRSRMVQG